ncbi:MAG: low molecular weight protein arginine phosphatase [Elusimicrobiota bacterium]|nr:low molecular weight protein arginine phosphatase [Elusimicrobiota bacterium]
MRINKITFVCTGNTCRSVMAEKIFNRMVRGTELENIESDSSGTAAMPHYRVFGDLKEVIEENGLSADGHVPRMVSSKIMEESDLIIVMTEAHRKNIMERFTGCKDKIFLLSEFAGEDSKDITDPIGKGIDVYRQTFNEIKEYMNKVIERLNNDPGKKRSNSI